EQVYAVGAEEGDPGDEQGGRHLVLILSDLLAVCSGSVRGRSRRGARLRGPRLRRCELRHTTASLLLRRRPLRSGSPSLPPHTPEPPPPPHRSSLELRA